MQLLSKAQLAQLENVAQESATRASQALSKLIGVPVKLQATRTRVIEKKNLASTLANPLDNVSAVMLPVSGEGIFGSSVLVSALEESYRLAELVMKRPKGSLTKLDALATSAITETANIIGGSFLTVLSNKINISLVQSAPTHLTHTIQGVINTAIAQLPAKDPNLAVALEIDFALSIVTTTTSEIFTNYIFFLEVAVVQKLLAALGK